MENRLRRVDHDGVVLHEVRDGMVSAAFTERSGGVSAAPYASLNLGSHVGDDPSDVEENRRRALSALGCEEGVDRLIVPNQVHGDRVVIVDGSDRETIDRARLEASEGADGIVCTVPGVPVLLCFADCVPVILTAPQGFSVVHSGWRGTFSRIASKAARSLAESSGCMMSDIRAYIGPHILGDEYEVSEELLNRFRLEFGWAEGGHGGRSGRAGGGDRLLDLARAIRQTLVEVGVPGEAIADLGLSTVRGNDRFFSYRAEGGVCGRHGAMAVMTNT